MRTDPQILARLNAIGEALSGDLYMIRVNKNLSMDPHVAWFAPADKLPDEDKPVFFMTDSGHWAGRRLDNDWCDWGDLGLICHNADVKLWQYAPELELAPAE